MYHQYRNSWERIPSGSFRCSLLEQADKLLRWACRLYSGIPMTITRMKRRDNKVCMAASFSFFNSRFYGCVLKCFLYLKHRKWCWPYRRFPVVPFPRNCDGILWKNVAFLRRWHNTFYDDLQQGFLHVRRQWRRSDSQIRDQRRDRGGIPSWRSSSR